MDRFLRQNVKESDGVTLKGGNCDGHDESDSIWLVEDGDNGVVYALYGVAFNNSRYTSDNGVYDFSYCFSFKREAMLAAFDKLRNNREMKAAQEQAVKRPEAESNVVLAEGEQGVAPVEPNDIDDDSDNVQGDSSMYTRDRLGDAGSSPSDPAA